MKRQELIAAGCIFVRPGGKHDLYMNPRTGKKQTVPRHMEIDENLARHILKIMT
jgi:predicted RNA binding protein YcfA (HicA-like mRNA interferase family)